VIHDRHVFGLFPEARWVALLREAGFAEVEVGRTPDAQHTFLARR
jgi:hypothetical protein